jgi:hypothetical protein
VAVAVRVLVAVEPRMYGEVLAFQVRQQRPQSDVIFAGPENLQAEAERSGPHLIVANEVPPRLREIGLWVELHIGEHIEADINADGYSTTIRDVSLQDLLAVIDKAEEALTHEP